MATMNLSICDLCNAVSKDGLPFRLAIRQKGKKGGAVKAEICQACNDDIASRIESEISFEQINKRKPPRQPKGTIELIDEDVARVPSNIDYDTAYNKTTNSGCGHEQTSFDHPYVQCKKCGEKWEA